MESQKYHVRINYKGELHDFYTKAPNKIKAYQNSLIQLAIKLEVAPGGLFNYFYDKQTSVKIREV